MDSLSSGSLLLFHGHGNVTAARTFNGNDDDNNNNNNNHNNKKKKN
jgi:hypothetical protein